MALAEALIEQKKKPGHFLPRNTPNTRKANEEEKQVLDQFTMNGGKSLWLIDQVAIEKDSLYNELGKTFAIARDLNLTDFFFKSIFRINNLSHLMNVL